MDKRSDNLSALRSRRRWRAPVAFLLDLFSSVWTGIVLAALLFVYCSIGSAMPQIRQHAWLEMTEFEWFHWWPFICLVTLFGITMAVVTIRRIPLRKINAGVWMIHGGVVILTIGSYLYFTTKVEGDAPVFRRQARIELPGMSEATTMVVLPGNQKRVRGEGGEWEFQIQSTNTEWPILSEEHKGEVAYAVNIMVAPPDGGSFIRQLLAGYPQYTEDVIPGKGRAIKSTGKKLLREELSLSLEYHPTYHFHVMDTWALFVRKLGETKWVERPIVGLPRYNERISSRNQVYFDPHHRIALRPIDLEVLPGEKGDALSGASVHVTGYLRYARMERRWREGGDRLNPVLRLSISSPRSGTESFELLALDPAHRIAGEGNIEFVWLRDGSRVDALPTDSRALLRIRLTESDETMEVPILANSLGQDFKPIGDGLFSYRINNIQDGLSIPGQDRPVSIAIVEIKTPEGATITRWVADQPGLSRDLRASQGDPHSTEAAEPDDRVVMTYQPGSAPLIFAGYPGGLHFIFNGADGRVMSRPIRSGESVEILGGLAVRVDQYVQNGVAEAKPYVVPPRARQRNVGELFSMIRLEVNADGTVQTVWVPFNRYVFPDRGYAYQGRFSYLPKRFRLADGGFVEVMFSRQRRRLPASIALEDFKIDAHPGGYTGSTSTIRNYISHLRFKDGGGWTDPEPIRVNAPTEFGGLWYFQSTWDKPSNADSGDGMNYTGLGIGNRNGVFVQLAGCCLAVIGMIFTFYVKPMMMRRRSGRSRTRASQSASVLEGTEASVGSPQTIGA